ARLAQQSKDPDALRILGRICLLAPNVGSDLKPVLEAAENAAHESKEPLELRTLGGLLLRAGRTEEAVKRLQEARAARELRKGQPGAPPHEDLLLVLAYQKLGQEADARRCLERALVWLDLDQRTRQAIAVWLAGVTGPLTAAQALVQPSPPDVRQLALG